MSEPERHQNSRRYPLVEEQFCAHLAGFKRGGVAFDIAWRLAWERTQFDHEREPRRASKRALGATREAWRAAYEDRSAGQAIAAAARHGSVGPAPPTREAERLLAVRYGEPATSAAST